MTLREVQCLLLLFRACPDGEVRRRATKLVPELSDWDELQKLPTPKRWLLIASADRVEIGRTVVVCREDEVAAHASGFRHGFDLAVNVTVEHKELPG
jgi:hypothetical protein